jgi:hypothetical protein
MYPAPRARDYGTIYQFVAHYDIHTWPELSVVFFQVCTI